MNIIIDDLGFDRGAHILIEATLRNLTVGSRLAVQGNAPELKIHLAAWCRANGHEYIAANETNVVGWIIRGEAMDARWLNAERVGDVQTPGKPVTTAPGRWGLAARGALLEAGAPEFHFPLNHRDQLWSDDAPRLYAQAAAAQWDPAKALDWTPPNLAPVVDDAVAQIMTFLIENENAALLVTARFLAQVHPHFHEIMQVLAIQAADEARHGEVFMRRAELCRAGIGRSTALGQRSLQTLVEEPDFVLASFMLAVMGEGTFLTLLAFIERHAPDPLTQNMMRLVIQDESRHVAFGIGHLRRLLISDPGQRQRLSAAVRRRSEALQQSAGLNQVVLDALVVLAAGALTPEAVGHGYDCVQQLRFDMDAGRKTRLNQLGFDSTEASELSALHTPNFM
jgi:TusA-related sulfurtransferase